MRKAFSYLRCSGDGQTTGDTFTRQWDVIFRYAKTNDIEIVETFRDEGVPGKTEMLNRPGLSSLLAALVENPDVKLVLIEIADRLARDIIVNELIVREFQALGVTVIAAESAVNLTSGDDQNPTAKLIRQILAAIAEFDRCVIVNKLRAARERLRTKNGKCEGRKAYGTREDERDTYREMMSMARAGYQPTKIARMLNDMGMFTRYGRKWNTGSVWRIISRQAKATETPQRTE